MNIFTLTKSIHKLFKKKLKCVLNYFLNNKLNGFTKNM